MAAMSDASAAAHEFFEGYAAALLARDEKAMARLYAVPSLIVFPGQSIAVSDAGQTEEFFASSWSQYEGVDEADKQIAIMGQGPSSVWADVTWPTAAACRSASATSSSRHPTGTRSPCSRLWHDSHSEVSASPRRRGPCCALASPTSVALSWIFVRYCGQPGGPGDRVDGEQLSRAAVLAYRAAVHDLEHPAATPAQCGVLETGVQRHTRWDHRPPGPDGQGGVASCGEPGTRP